MILICITQDKLKKPRGFKKMFNKGSLIINPTRKLLYKVIEIDEEKGDYILKQIFPEPKSIEIIRKDIYEINRDCRKIL